MTTDIDPHEYNRRLIAEYLTTDGALTGDFTGQPVLLLTTRGWRTGRPHLTPLVYGLDAGRVYVVATKGGAPTNPTWYRNLITNPAVDVRIGPDRQPAQAVEVTDPAERNRLYNLLAATTPGLSTYQAMTTRTIPVIVLDGIQPLTSSGTPDP